MSPWDGASRWINTLLLVVVGFIGFDTLFRLLEANERNVIVGFTRSVATVLLSPFEGMFDEQEYLLTALIAVLGYALVAGIAMAVVRSVQASRRRKRRAGEVPPEGPADGAWQSRAHQQPGAIGAETAELPGASPAPQGRARDATRERAARPPDERGDQSGGADARGGDLGPGSSRARGGPDADTSAPRAASQPSGSDGRAPQRTEPFPGGGAADGNAPGPSNGRVRRSSS